MKQYEYKPQRVLKESATDNWSGDARAVSARTRLTTVPYYISEHKSLGYSWVNFDDTESLTPGLYELKIKATKSTLSTVEFWGVWYAD